MRSNLPHWILISLISAMAGSGCGLFGSNKKEGDRVFQTQANLGCLNGLGKKVGRYFKADIEDSEWDEIFSCVDDQVRFFKKYVHGNAVNGYNEKDIASLVRNFLITENKV